ncbi:MAG: hypothetical protein FIB06_09850 [Betaproteobacteria bacterium]|nr:hypothetical protein [Betaproteobacteria bacterium]
MRRGDVAGLMNAELRAALVDDLDQLLRLHDRELDGETLAALAAADFPLGLALMPRSDPLPAPWRQMADAVRGLPAVIDKAVLDELAADYAAIYLNQACGASPYESVWLDDDHLACQAPMFELRAIYAAAGLKVADWRQRFDDHLVLQLQYLRHVIATDAVDGLAMADFIDEHLGFWFPDFADRVAARCHTDFYAALAGLTCEWLRSFRFMLAALSGRPLPEHAEIAARIDRKRIRGRGEVAPLRFMPGAQGPSW